MGWIITTRNPRTKKRIITDGDELDSVAEFATESDANVVAMAVPVCEARGYRTVEIEGER